MNSPWSSVKLRALRARGGGLLFGFMHEDPAPELALLPPGGRAACVLSAGDVAFALAQAGASSVIAADVNPAQHALVRLKLALAQKGCTGPQARALTVRQGLASAASFTWLTADVKPLLQKAGVLDRALTTSGDVDARLAFLARSILPWVAPAALREEGAGVRTLSSHRWKAAWKGMGLLLRLVFPAALRRQLPYDVSLRLRRRLESALRMSRAWENPWLHRILLPPSRFDETSLATAWPGTCSVDAGRLHLHSGPLDEAMHHGGFDLVATSNIFDTQPGEALNAFLETIANQVRPGAEVVVRSLFRNASDWPAQSPGWRVNVVATERLIAMDRSPLCRVSLVVERARIG